jgi:diguanylate cyclase (GGDEF)-like protein
LSRADRRSRQVAVLFSDLDRFKPVNDTYGHEVGDRVLKEVGRRLAACVRSSDLVARLGGDEFVTVIEDVSSVEDAKEVAGKIVAAMAEPFHTGDITVQVGSSVGIAVYPEHGRHTRVLIRRADEALYDAKEAGRNGFQVWGTPA